MVVLEAWSVARPALVNGECDVVANHCRESHGGGWYKDFEEWATALSVIDEGSMNILGRQERDYVRKHYSWDRVEREYLDLLA